jgi:septal ring factor EnvC (AmiA/AmiB activator)
MRKLMMEKQADSIAAQKEEEELRQLMVSLPPSRLYLSSHPSCHRSCINLLSCEQEMEERLRKEQYDIEVANQKLAAELKASKLSQLDDMAAQVRRELAALEKSRLDMEAEMTRKQQEIESLHREVRQAEASLIEEDRAKQSRFAGLSIGFSYNLSLSSLIFFSYHHRKSRL